jgi:uncharacterized DUF497 family protein
LAEAIRHAVKFDWNRDKAKRNKAKHGVDFESAKKFEFDTANIFEDDSENYGEERYVGFGFIGNKIHCIVYTIREGDVRVISLRRTTKKEAEDYVRYIEETY